MASGFKQMLLLKIVVRSQQSVVRGQGAIKRMQKSKCKMTNKTQRF
jgi:hypothetical protein